MGADLNSGILNMGANTYGTEITLLIRVTDAGAETSGFNSRVQVSVNGGSTWFYDTATDSELSNGFRFDGAGRYVMWDVAPGAGDVTYDNFSINWISGPRTWTGAGANGNWSTGLNWGGAVPISGNQLTFNGTTRQVNTNDLSGLTVPSLTFNNGGFTLWGNEISLSGTVSNLAGVNTLKGNVAWSSTSAKVWHIDSGSELVLDNTTTIDVSGGHSINGGGSLRVKGATSIGQASLANPPFMLNEGKHIVDGGTFASRGGYRIGSQATGGGAQTILTNGATFTLTASGANLRVGDSANPNTSALILNSSTLSLSGGILSLPHVTGASGNVSQTGGTISGGTISFSESGAGTGSFNGTLEPVQIRKNNASGNASIYFDGAILRPASGAHATFFTGLNLAQIQPGGLTINATADVTIGQSLSGSGALTKTGGGKVTFTGANTYSGSTTISAGTLALGSGGSLGNTPGITIANGTTFDVSAVTFALGSGKTIARNATSGVGNINGSLTLGSGSSISLQLNSANGSVGTLNIAGGLTLNSNVIAINVVGSPLGLGTYPLVNYSGAKSGFFNVTPSVSGAGLEMGLAAKIVESSGQISLKVFVPAHGVAAASLKVVQHDLTNTTNSVDVTASRSINGLQVRSGSNRGDFNVQVGAFAADDVNGGVLLTSVAENGRDHGEDSGINFCTSSISVNAGGYFIPIASAPGAQEYNINVAAAYFPYDQWIGGYVRNSAGTAGGANNLLTGSPGLALGTHFVDHGDGLSTVNLTSLGIHSQTDGVLLVTDAGNNSLYALSKANTDGTWSVYVRSNSVSGAATTQGPVAFAFVPKSNISVISGRFLGDGTIALHNGTTPRFSVTNISSGNWRLTIPGHSPSSGVLIISAEGGSSNNQDNIVSYQASGNNWIIQSRDLPGLGQQALPASEAVVSFVFIPGPTATLVSPANSSTVSSSSPTLTVSANHSGEGNLTVTFYGHEAPQPGPGRDFLIPVLPDTQNYAREESGIGQATKEMWFAQTDWIVQNRISQNIAYVATLGDCVHNATAHWQWRNATNAMYRLEKQSTTFLVDGIPYGITVGNHDQDTHGDPDSLTTYYNQYFGTAHFAGKAYYGGHFGSNNDNWYQLFSAGGMDFLVFSFEFGRYGSTILNWAQNVINQYPNRRIIVLTHHAGSDNHPSSLSNQGSAIYDALKVNPNFFLMLGGHVFNGSGHGEGHRTNTFNGNRVYTLVSNYQNRNNGGNGLMRLMYFSPSNNVISVKTYSPWTGNYETDFNSQFTLPYNMQPNGAGTPGTPYAALKTNLNVVPGAQTSFVWSGRQTDKPYEWYVTVTDEVGDYSTSVEWTFNTAASFARMAVVDENGNGLPDDWEAGFGVSDPDADDDGDGHSNYAEFLAKTNPLDASSVLKILDGSWQTDGSFKLTWMSVGGVRYRIQYADDLSVGLENGFFDIARGPEAELDAAVSGEASIRTFTDTFEETGPPQNGVRYYRVKVVP
ncbi:MAG: autotransporter-associated beta strand repeat-containing protein [Limisphaerales bacterium]